MIGHHAVDLFRHPPVETPQPRLYVSHPHRQLRRRQRARQSGIRVAVDQQVVWPFGQQNIFDSLEHGRGLRGVRTGPRPKVGVRPGQFQPVEEDSGHFVVVVLPRVNQEFPVPLAQRAADRRCLDELGPSSDN